MSDFSPSMQDGYRISDGPLYGGDEAIVYQFNITNMDEAALKITELNRCTDEGIEVVKKIDAHLTALPQCWRGSDANKHMDNLFKIRDHCHSLVVIALEFSIQAYNEIKRMQETIEANGGKAVSIGSLTVLEANIEHINLYKRFQELYVDTVAARNEIASLKNTQALFIDYSNKIIKDWDYMLEIWKAGWHRASLEYGINSFKSKLDMYKENFEQAIKALEKAIQTWES